MALWYIFCQDALLLTSDNSIPQSLECPVPLQPWQTVICLPDTADGTPQRAVSIDTPYINKKEVYHHVGLRQSYALLPRERYLAAGKARELLYWDANTRYCGVCGAPMHMHTIIAALRANRQNDAKYRNAKKRAGGGLLNSQLA